MAKQRIQNYVFFPGVSSSANVSPNAYSLIRQNQDFIKAEALAYISTTIATENATNLAQNAISLLTNNKTFLQDEIVAWTNYQVANNVTNFVGYTYDVAKCKRDVGFVIDAYLYDLRYGGNEQTISVASQYWLGGTRQVSNAAAEVLIHQKLRDIINNFIFTRSAYTSQQSPSTSSQNTSGTNAEAGTTTTITNLSALITDVIANGLSVLPTPTASVKNFAGYTYDVAKCRRDIGYVLDAYLNDLRYGGNIKTRYVASRYWEGNNPVIDGDRKPEILTHQFIRDLIVTYILPQATYSNPLQLVETKIATPGSTTEAGAAARITSLANSLVSVITNGLGSLPAATPGVSSIKVQGKHDIGELLLITNTSNNQVLYNFSDPSLGATTDTNTAYNSTGNYRDDDFPSFLATSDYVTTIILKADTSTSTSADQLQIFVEGKEQRVRPYDFGTDAIERMRVAMPQAMLDADFEYGLQPTKWQAIGIARGYPSVYEVPGTDTPVVSVVTDASQGTGGFGESLITVTTSGAHGLTVGTPITIKALANSISGFSRAEGTFIVNTVPGATTFTYYATAKVGSIPGAVLATTYTQLRKAAFYTGASIGAPTFGIYSQGSNTTFYSKFVTAIGVDQLAFTGTAPPVGGPLTGAGLGSGSQVTGIVGPGGSNPAVTVNVQNSVAIGETAVTVASSAGILQGMAVDDGNGNSVFVVSIAGTTVNLTGPIATARNGYTQTYLNLSGSNIVSVGVNAVFTVYRTGANYSSVTVTTAGTGYAIGDRLLIQGPEGISPTNDITVSVTGVDGSGGITTLTYTGVSVDGSAVFYGLAQNASDGSGNGATFDITSRFGVYTANIGQFGSAYTVGEQLTFTGANVGGLTPANNATVTVTGIQKAYLNLTQSSTSGIGSGATFNIIRTGNTYRAVVVNVGANYADGNTVTFLGSLLGGANGTNNCVITITGVSGGQITSISETVVGTAVTTGTGSIYSFTIAGTASSSDRDFPGQIATNINAVGAGATFDVTRSNLGYSAIINLRGSNYAVGDRIRILGTDLGGASPANDVVLAVSALFAPSGVDTVTASGTSVGGGTISFWSAITFSELTTSSIPDNTTIVSSAIAKIQITFNTAHGLVPGAGVLVNIGSTGTGHSLAAGPYYVEAVPSLTTLVYTMRSPGTIDVSTIPLTGTIYPRPDVFFVHRPYDGGVQLGTGGPQHGVQAIRMSKKYIRYQSGKGLMYTTGALFAPSYNLLSLTATGLGAGAYITIVTDDVDHGCQVGGVIKIIGVDTSGYNGTYRVSDVVNERTLRVQAQTVLGNIYATVSTSAQISVQQWHGATVRAGCFDDQNGMYWQYNGQSLAVGRRTSTFQLSGTASIAKDTNAITGTNTRFRDQLKAGDRITIKGMTHVVTNVTSQTTMNVTPDYRGAIDAVQSKICLVSDIIFPQNKWNIDKLDGTGPSGYNIDVSKMQMIGLQYTWYGAGFIDYMLRGSDGNFVFCHRIRNSNVNTEAFMRTGNLPVRYEVINESASSKLQSSITASQTTIQLVDASSFPNEQGIVYIDNELIEFSGKSGNSLVGCTRAAPMVNFSAGSQRTFTAGTASTHEYNTGVVLVSNTISPIISHWGSAYLTDGRFDEDRGYIFNYASTGISASTTKQTAFLIRLAPSVSNAITGDLGARELLNRAQLLLKAVEVTVESDTSGGGLVIEGVLNPQNYPLDPANISWGGLSGLSAGGQPSFAQIAPGGSVSWSSGAIQTTATATTIGILSASVTIYYSSYYSNVNYIYMTKSSWDSSGVVVGSRINDAKFPSGTIVTGAQDNGSYYYVTTSQNSNQALNAGASITFNLGGTLTGTNYLYFTQSSWVALGAAVGTEVQDTLFPAGTRVSQILGPYTFGGTAYYRINFTQNSKGAVAGAANITFVFGQPPYALPGEQIFSFIASQGGASSLALGELKELTNTTLGGRGAYPNGPDVLAINVYKTSGTAVGCNIIIRWGEAQA